MLDHHRLASVHFKWYLDALSSHQLKTVVKSWTPSHAPIQEQLLLQALSDKKKDVTVATSIERADLLALFCVMLSCVFVTFPYGVLGRCGT